MALTANVLAHQRQAYLDAGMDGVVGKPIAPGVLLAEIAQAAANRDVPDDEQDTAAALEAAQRLTRIGRPLIREAQVAHSTVGGGVMRWKVRPPWVTVTIRQGA